MTGTYWRNSTRLPICAFYDPGGTGFLVQKKVDNFSEEPFVCMLARQKNGASVLQNNYPTALLPRQKNNDSVLQKNHQEQIVTYCEDSEVRSATLFNLSDSYYKYGDMDKALQYAYKLPNLYKTRENALVSILTDKKEKRKVAEEALKPLLWALELHMTTIAEIDGNLEYLDKLRMIKECMIKDEKENG